MKTLIHSIAAFALTTPAAFAQSFSGGGGTPSFSGGTGTIIPKTTPVPEISALEGTAALAAVAAIVLLVWERRRRAA